MFHYLVQHLNHLHHYSRNVESDDLLNYDHENESGEQCSPIQSNENKHCGGAKILQVENADKVGLWSRAFAAASLIVSRSELLVSV